MKQSSFEINIVATPIGNLNDISKRAIETIESGDIIICENPKHSLKLLNKLGIKKKLISIHDHNEQIIIDRLSKDLFNKKIVLISDAGSPLISDPGFKFIKHCIKNNIQITTVPGPTSIISALQLSGIPVNEFFFAGFFPKSKKETLNFIKKIKNNDKTSVFFVSNHKLERCLELLETEINDRLISLSKELTKINEKTFRGLAAKIKEKLFENKDNFKGEFVVVVEGNSLKETLSNDLNYLDEEIYKLLSKFSLTDVVEIVHKLTGITKNKVYKWVLNLKNS